MTVRNVALPYGDESIEIRIPENNLVGVYSPRDVAPVADVRLEIRRALEEPIGSRPLSEQLQGRKNAAQK